jgi:ammonium transporter Rh
MKMGQEDEARHTMVGAEKKGKDVDYGHPKTAGHSDNSIQFALLLGVCQIAFMILFGLFTDYSPEVKGHGPEGAGDYELTRIYPWFQDTHVMIVVGFGFLMTFLKRYGWSSLGFNFLFTGFCIQWAILVAGFFHHMANAGHDNATHGEAGKMISIDMHMMLEADFTTGAILISFGAVLGVASPVQLLLMILFEVVFYNINAYICINFLSISDMGGSMIVHAFGCYFGLAVARCLYKPGAIMDNHAEGAEYHSDLFSMIGTVFLWMFWPSFNSAPGASGDEHRYVAVINTYLALCSACVATFIASTLTNPKKKITMEHIQNATLAGGVAMGTASDMDVTPAGALAIGFAAGVLSTVGYAYIKPTLAASLKLHDTCGVNNLHGMPAIMAAIVSIIVTAMNPSAYVVDGSEVSWLNQLYCLLCTLGLAIVSGGITGAILRIPQIESLGDYEYFEDGKYWEIEEEEEED